MEGLNGGYLGWIVQPDWDDDLIPDWVALMARAEDAWWADRIRLPFTWQGFLEWWIARRWLMPADPRDVEEWHYTKGIIL